MLDGHVHIGYESKNDGSFILQMRLAGMEGGVIMSLSPNGFGDRSAFYTHKERLEGLFAMVAGHETLYPFFWINPVAEDASEQVLLAESMGVMGYKVICSSHYPCDDRAMKTYEMIAAAGKPILFHSGILWDGKPSSQFNKPVEFEPLLGIHHLRFCLAHISWPWYDENIAVYGKFLNAYSLHPDLSVEMFVDLTPGTPPVYREEALTRLFMSEYDVENNVIFGTDCNTLHYNHKWTSDWVIRDNAIYDKIGIGEDIRRKIYGDNLRRFIGISKVPVQRRKLIPGE